MSYNSGNPVHNDDNMHSTAHYQEFTYTDSAVAESRPPLFPASSSQIHPHPHPLFTRQDGINSRSLEPHGLANYHSLHPFSTSATHHHQPHSPDHDSPHSWPPYNEQFPQTQQQGPLLYAPFPSPSPFPPPRLSPPPVHHQSFHFKGQGLTAGSTTAGHRMTLAGSLDPNTGIFYRTPEHPRLRTAQACEKCRTRKAKCSGEHPSCKRCITRGLVCEYAKEGRVRGPNKPKGKGSTTGMPTVSNSNNDSPNTQSSSTTNVRASYRNRTSSNHSSADSRESDHPDSIPPSVRSALLRTENIPDGLSSGNGSRGSLRSRRNSHSGTVGDPFPSRSRTVHDLPFDTAPNVFRLNGENTGPMSASPLSLERDVEPNLFPFPSDRHERVGLGMEPWENVGQKFPRGLGIVAHPNSQGQGDLSRSQHQNSVTLLSPLMKDLVPRGMSQTHGRSNDSENLISNHSQNLLPMGMNVGFQGGSSGSIDNHEFIYPQSYADPLSSIVGSQHPHAHMASPGDSSISSRIGSPLVPISGGAMPGMIERHRQDYPLESKPQHHHRGRNEDVRFEIDSTFRVSQPHFISQRSPFPHSGMVDQIVHDERGHGYAKTNGHSDMEHTFDGQTTHSDQQSGIDLHC